MLGAWTAGAPQLNLGVMWPQVFSQSQRRVRHRMWRVVAVAALLGCSGDRRHKATDHPITATLQWQIAGGWRPESKVLVRGDSVAGSLTVAGELQAPTQCGTLSLKASPETFVKDTLVLLLHFERRPPGPPVDCAASAGMYAVRAVVGPLQPGVYRVRVRYSHYREDGSAQIDAVAADTVVRISLPTSSQAPAT